MSTEAISANKRIYKALGEHSYGVNALTILDLGKVFDLCNIALPAERTTVLTAAMSNIEALNVATNISHCTLHPAH